MTGGLVSFPSVMDLYDVKEMFSRYYVDPDIARQNIPSKWKVKIHDNGKALLLVMVQTCKKMVLDYIFNVGSQWVCLTSGSNSRALMRSLPPCLGLRGPCLLGTGTSCHTSLMVIWLIRSLSLRASTPDWSRRYR